MRPEEAAWWGWNLQKFLDYCRTHPAGTPDVRTAANAFLESLQYAEPPVHPRRVDQVRQALTVFVRGIENWHWETDETGTTNPRFRVKPRTEPQVSADTSQPTPPDDASPGNTATGPTPEPVVAPPGAASPGFVSVSVRSGLLERAKTALRTRHYAYRSEKTYLGWVARFLAFVEATPPEHLTTADLQRFLEHLAVERKVSASTQNQAFNALLFLYRQVLEHRLQGIQAVRAEKKTHLPVVLTAEETRRPLAVMTGSKQPTAWA